MPARRRPSPQSIAAAARKTLGAEESKDALAIELKARGKTLYDIARALRCSTNAARARLDRALAERKLESSDEAIALDVERVERIFEGLVEKGAFDGKTGPAAIAIKLLERRAKYFGLDRPDRHEHTGKDGAPLLDLATLTDDQLRALASGILPAVAGADGSGGARAPTPATDSPAAPACTAPDAPVAGADAPPGDHGPGRAGGV